MADPRIEWYPDRNVPRQGTVRVVNVPQPYTLAFGDGTTVAKDHDDIYDHTYAVAGRYHLTVTLTGTTDVVASLLLRVLDATEPNVTISAPPNTQTIRVAFNDPAMPVVGRYTVDWTTSDSEDVIAEPGAFVERVFAPGTYPIRVTDHWSWLSMVEQVTVAPVVDDPDFSLTQAPSDPGGMTALIEILGVPAAGAGDTLTVDWGDGQTETIVAGVGVMANHDYAWADTYMVTVSYTADASMSTTQFAAVPFAA